MVHERQSCHATECPLHEFRLGRNPNITEATKGALAERLKARGGFIRRQCVTAYTIFEPIFMRVYGR